MNQRIRAAAPLALVGLGVLVVALDVARENVRSDAVEGASDGLMRLRDLDRAVDVEVLRARTDLSASYDAATRALTRARAAVEQIAATGHDDLFDARALSAAIPRKATLTHDFLAENALYETSLLSLPRLVARMDARSADIAATALQLRAEVMTSRAGDANQTVAWLQAIADVAAAADRRGRTPAHEAVLTHLESIVALHAGVEESLQAVLAPDARVAIGSAQAQLRAVEASRLLVLRSSWLALFSSSALLLLLFVRAASALRRANETLEARVKERTTEVERAHTRLAATERLSTVGQLSAGVAHEINNPLAVVVSNLSFVEEELAPHASIVGAEVAAAIADAQGGAARVAAIVKGLSAFSHVGGERNDPICLRATVEDAVRVAGNDIRHKGTLIVDVAAEAPMVDGDARKVLQVVVNMLVNAGHALPDGGATGNLVKVSVGADAGGNAVLAVQDTGVGMTDEVRARVFDPFFTTRTIGKGTGLGLSICHGIVTAMGGSIAVASAPGQGATFTITFPPSRQAPAPRPAAPSAAPVAPPARPRVLVVDDEPHIGRAVARVLQGDHDVTAVDSARGALDLLLAGRRYDVILCDVMMPVMSGIELYERLAAQVPDAARAVVFLSGGAFTTKAQAFLESTDAPCWQKPLDVKALRDGISQRVSLALAA